MPDYAQSLQRANLANKQGALAQGISQHQRALDAAPHAITSQLA
jgi:hypothetical protein